MASRLNYYKALYNACNDYPKMDGNRNAWLNQYLKPAIKQNCIYKGDTEELDPLWADFILNYIIKEFVL